MRRHLAAAGPASAGAAWERYADPQLWPTWSPQIAAVETSTPRLATGTTGVVHGHGGLLLDFLVEQVDDAARRWSWSVVPRRAGGLPLPEALQRLGRLHLVHAVLDSGLGEGAGSGSSTGSATTLLVTGSAPVVAAYAPLAGLALGRLVR